MTQPALADATFVERTHARHGEGNRPHFVLEIRRRSRIHHVAQRLADHRDAVERDDHARKQRRPIVSRLPPLATPQRDTDPHKRRRRSQRIRVVVQRLDAQRGAADFLTRHNHPAREPHLRHNDARQQHQRPPSRPLVRRHNFVDRVHGDPASHEEHEHRDRQRGQRLCFPVTVGVIRIGWFRGDPKARPDQQRGENIQHRFRPVSNQRVSVTENPAREFHGREHGIQRDAAQDQLRARVCAALGSGIMARQFGRHPRQQGNNPAPPRARN